MSHAPTEVVDQGRRLRGILGGRLRGLFELDGIAERQHGCRAIDGAVHCGQCARCQRRRVHGHELPGDG